MQRFGVIVARLFGRLTALIVGFILAAAGLAMMVTIVMLPAGVVVMLLGILLFIYGLFARDRTAPASRHR